MAATEPIRNKHQIRELAGYYLCKGQLRNYVLIVMGVHTALRISDEYCKHKLKKYCSLFSGRRLMNRLSLSLRPIPAV